MSQWYYTQNGQQVGPVDEAQLQGLISAGQLGPSEMAWNEGMASWQAVSTLPELLGEPAMQPATAPYGQYGQPAGYGAPVGTVGYYTPQPDPFVYAGFWIRFAAVFIDGLIINGPFIVIRLILTGASNDYLRDPTGTTAMLVLLLNLGSIVASWLYFALQESSPRQATLGKRALGIRVTDLNGQRITFGRATGRYFGKIISSCTLMIGYMMAGFTQRKQALHDTIAGTLVVRN